VAGDLDRGRRARPLDRGVVSPDAPSVGGGFKPRRRASALRRAGDTPSTRTMATTRAATPTRAFGARRASGPEAGPRRARAGARAWGARRFAASPGAHPLPTAGWRRARRCGGDARARRGVVVLALAGEARDEGADAVRRLKIFSVNDGAPRDPAAPRRRVFRTFARLARLALPRLALPRARRRPRRASRRRSRRPPRFRSKRRGARPRPAPARARAPGRPTPASGPGRHARRISRENTRLRATPTAVADEIFSATATTSKPASVFPRARARASLRSRARSRATVLSHALRPIISPRPPLTAQSTSCTTSAP
jgi:hypothetical protein